LLVILDLGLLIIREEPGDALIAAEQRLRDAGRHHCVDLAVEQSLLDALAFLDDLDVEAFLMHEGNIVRPVGQPFHILMREAVMLAERAAQPGASRGEHAAAAAEFSAFEVGGLFYPLRRVDEDEAVAETAMEEDRQRDIRMAAIARHVIAAEIE